MFLQPNSRKAAAARLMRASRDDEEFSFVKLKTPLPDRWALGALRIQWKDSRLIGGSPGCRLVGDAEVVGAQRAKGLSR